MSVRIKSGVNDLAVTHPELAKQWHPTKNLPTTIDTLGKGSKFSAWWVCDNDHEWQVAVQKRTAGSKCPYCLNQRVWSGYNDLVTTHPELAKQWHPTKNGDLTPENTIAGTNKRVWWQCVKGHEWEATGSDRTHGKGCPMCSGQRLLTGYNDLATTDPELAKQWHPTKNGDLTPEQINGGTHKKFWWLCENGHEWQATSVSRFRGGKTCPICVGQTVLTGYNDLATTHPELAKQWHPTKNGDLTPELVVAGSGKKYWWQCEKGHEWQAVGANRKLRDDGCPVCANKVVLFGYNDLTTTNPELTKQWHPTKNGDLTPAMVHVNSRNRVWWQCDKGHEWQVAVQHRNAGLTGCPICSNKQVLDGYNDMATTHPELAKQWHPTKNGDLTPHDLTAKSAKNVWWQCDSETPHSWRAAPANRSGVNETGCPTCAKSGYNPTLTGLLYFIENETLRARKIGITNPDAKQDRVGAFGRYGWSVIRTYTSNDGYVVADTERVLLNWVRKDLGLPVFLGVQEMQNMGGHSETFSGDGPTNEEIIAKIETVFAEFSNRN